MSPTGTSSVAITPQGIRDGDPAVLAALAGRRGPAVTAFAEIVCEPRYVVRAAADAFARFRAAVADPDADVSVHPDALLLRCARRAALELAPRGPELGCGPALELLVARAERTIGSRDAALLNRHLETCEHCSDLSRNLDAADRAYREADETALDPSVLAPIVAAMAAAAPVRPPAVPDEAAVLPSGPPSPQTQDGAETFEPEETLEPEPEETPEPEPEETPEPEPEETLEADRDEDDDLPRETPLGTRRVTGAPSSYYQIPTPPPRERAGRAKQGALSLRRRAGRAARKRLDRAQTTPPPPPAQEPEPAVSPEEARIWRPVDSIEFPAVTLPDPDPELAPEHAAVDPEGFPALDIQASPYDEPDMRDSAARAAARHYRRLRHRSQDEQEQAPPDGGPPRLERPERDRGTHLPLRAHGPRHLVLPAVLLVIAALVIMAVSGVFGGGSETPTSGTAAKAPAEVSLVTQSATSISLSDAERVAARAGTETP